MVRITNLEDIISPILPVLGCYLCISYKVCCEKINIFAATETLVGSKRGGGGKNLIRQNC